MRGMHGVIRELAETGGGRHGGGGRGETRGGHDWDVNVFISRNLSSFQHVFGIHE